MMENVQKIKIKLENIWIDLIKSIYAPYIKSWKGNNVQLVQWISSVYMSTSSKYKKNSSSAVDILRDQAEEAPLHRTQP